MSKFAEFINKIWIDCNGNFKKQLSLIGAAIFAMGTVVIIAVYFPWLILLIIGIGAWVFIEKYERKIKAKQDEQQLRVSVVHILRLALEGLESHFGLAKIEDKGFQSLRSGKVRPKQSIRKFVLFYARLPNATDLEDHRTCEQMRKIVNSSILVVVKNLVHEAVGSIPIYVTDIRVSDGKLVLTVVPIIDNDSYEFVEKHHVHTTRKAAIGDNEEGRYIKNAGRGELFDDEL